jgi:conjugative transfer signal peptidase TraF
MAEARNLAVVRWGEALRRDRKARRRFRLRMAAMVAASLSTCGLAATLIWRPGPLLIWNASASSPIGLYWVSAGAAVRPGDMVAAFLPAQSRILAAERGYLPAGVPLVKRVAAGPGDRVCAVGESVFINAEPIAFRRIADARGRRLAGWTGCEDLDGDQLFLLGSSGASFDGRYFGVSGRSQLIGRARLIWPR